MEKRIEERNNLGKTYDKRAEYNMISTIAMPYMERQVRDSDGQIPIAIRYKSRFSRIRGFDFTVRDFI